VAEDLAKALGQSVTVENKPGANGNIAAVDVARSPADGHTLLVGSSGTHAANVSLYAKLQYDPVKDFTPLTLMTVYPLLIVPGVAFKGSSIEELIAWLREQGSRASYGSSGGGSPTNMAGELFKRETETTMIHVPYRGQGPALTDLIGGRLELMFPSVPDTLSFLQAGTLRALAIMAPARSKVLPAVPTTAEVGYPKLLGSIWIGLYTTAGTPQGVIDKLNRELVRIVDSATFRNRVEAVGYEARPMDVEAFRKFNLDETARWGEIIRANGIRLE
jgi:tripartite-type tricarboxylate transporter receptor subunit TctC